MQCVQKQTVGEAFTYSIQNPDTYKTIPESVVYRTDGSIYDHNVEKEVFYLIPSFPTYGNTDLNILAVSRTGETKNFVIENINFTYSESVIFNSIEYTPGDGNDKQRLYTVYDSLGEPRTILLNVFTFFNHNAPDGFNYIDTFSLGLLFFYESFATIIETLHQFDINRALRGPNDGPLKYDNTNIYYINPKGVDLVPLKNGFFAVIVSLSPSLPSTENVLSSEIYPSTYKIYFYKLYSPHDPQYDGEGGLLKFLREEEFPVAELHEQNENLWYKNVNSQDLYNFWLYGNIDVYYVRVDRLNENLISISSIIEFWTYKSILRIVKIRYDTDGEEEYPRVDMISPSYFINSGSYNDDYFDLVDDLGNIVQQVFYKGNRLYLVLPIYHFQDEEPEAIYEAPALLEYEIDNSNLYVNKLNYYVLGSVKKYLYNSTYRYFSFDSSFTDIYRFIDIKIPDELFISAHYYKTGEVVSDVSMIRKEDYLINMFQNFYEKEGLIYTQTSCSFLSSVPISIQNVGEYYYRTLGAYLVNIPHPFIFEDGKIKIYLLIPIINTSNISSVENHDYHGISTTFNDNKVFTFIFTYPPQNPAL